MLGEKIVFSVRLSSFGQFLTHMLQKSRPKRQNSGELYMIRL